MKREESAVAYSAGYAFDSRERLHKAGGLVETVCTSLTRREEENGGNTAAVVKKQKAGGVHVQREAGLGAPLQSHSLATVSMLVGYTASL